jgi:alanine racemase
VVSTLDQIAAWGDEARRVGERLPAALHVDTGMARLGLSEAEVDLLAAEPNRLAGFDLRLIISHLASAEEPENPSNERQRATFERLRAKLPQAEASFANSSGVFLGAPFHLDLLRPGAALYGVAPRAGEANPLVSAVRLSARVLRLADLAAGTAVGYGGRFVAATSTRIATVSVGYADGFLRSLAGRAFAGFAGRRLPIVGAVSMDMIAVDVSALPEGALREGDFIDVIGGDADDVDTLARAAGTIGYEILTSLGARYQRRWISRHSTF